jgi:hypothetical protein
MQHLDDALIAEWVDGALPPDSPQYAAIAAHVEQCDECRARVEEERALAGHVRQLLGVAVPPARIPPFEEVLHRAGTAPPRAAAAGLPWRRLAWAATVVVAGGVGWYARGLVTDASDRGIDGSMVALEVGGVLQPQDDATDRQIDESTITSEASGTTQRQEAVTPGGPTQAADAAAPVPNPEAAARKRAADELLAARRDAAPPAAPAAAEPRPLAAVSAPAENEFRAQKAGVGPWIAATRTDAERVLGGTLLIVEGLPITGVDVAADSAAVRVRQELADGVTLDLVQSRVAARDAAPAEAVAGAALEIRARIAQVGPPVVDTVLAGIRVSASAPVSPDSLRVLLSRIRR